MRYDLLLRKPPERAPTASWVAGRRRRAVDPAGWTVTLVGSVAALCTTGAFVPQVLRVWRLKSAREISLATFLVFAVGTFAWLVYGLFIGSLPVIAANAATFVLAVTMVVAKLVYDRSPAAVPAP